MKYLLPVFIFAILQSCFESPVDPPKEELKLIQLWSYAHEIIGVGDASPVVSGNKIFASGGLYLFALEEKTGKLSWETQIDDDHELQGEKLIIKNGQIVANHLKSIRGWNLKDGQLEWEYLYSDELEPRRNGNHSVTKSGYVFSTYNSKLFELNNLGEISLVKQLDKKFIVHGVSYYNNKLYVSQTQTIHGALTLGRITALDAQTGDSLWVYDTEQGGFVRGIAIIENNILYAGAFGNSPINEAVALDAETGEVIWKYESDYIYTRNAALGPRHYYVNTGGSLAALDKQTGELKWRAEWLGTASTKPVYLGGFVYQTNYSEIMIIDDETGQVVHKEYSPDGTTIWHVAASSDKLFAQTSRQLIAYQPWHLRDN